MLSGLALGLGLIALSGCCTLTGYLLGRSIDEASGTPIPFPACGDSLAARRPTLALRLVDGTRARGELVRVECEEETLLVLGRTSQRASAFREDAPAPLTKIERRAVSQIEIQDSEWRSALGSIGMIADVALLSLAWVTVIHADWGLR